MSLNGLLKHHHFKILLAILIFSFLLKLPRIQDELRFKFDAANATCTTFISASVNNNPTSRLFQPIDFRMYEKAMETGKEVLYIHTPPLAFLGLGSSVIIQGQSEADARFFSAIICLLSVFFLYLMSTELAGRNIGLIAAALYAFNGHLLHYGRIADPLITNSALVPLVVWFYLKYLKENKLSYLIYWLLSLYIVMLMDWNAYGFAAFFGLHQIIFYQKKSIKLVLSLTALVFFSLLTVLTVFSIASGGFDHVVADFSDSVGTRTSFPILQYIKMEIFRQFKIQSFFIILVPIASIIMLFYLNNKEEKKLWITVFLLLIAGLIFPTVTMRVAAIHEFWIYWVYPSIYFGAALLVTKIFHYNHLGKVTVISLLLLYSFHSFWVYKNRYFKYDNDYILARYLGQHYQKEHGKGGILITDTQDLIQVMQFYAQAEYIIQVSDLKHLKKVVDIWKNSPVKLPFQFITIKAQDLLKARPTLNKFPTKKLTQEYNTHIDESSEIWSYLKNNFNQSKKGSFFWFTQFKS